MAIVDTRTAQHGVERPPIFIVGQSRGGTTVLRDVLKTDPDIGGPYVDDRFLYLYYERYGDLRRNGNFNRLLSDIAESTFFRMDFGDGRDVLGLLEQTERTYKGVLTTLMSEIARRHGANRWVAKVGHQPRRAIQAVATMFPDALFIQVVRDPRDVCSSRIRRRGTDLALSKSQRLSMCLNSAVAWLDVLAAGRTWASKLGIERFMTIRYEDLVLSPGAMLRQISAFVGTEITVETMASGMREATQRSTLNKPWSSFGDTDQGLITGPVGRYKGFLTDREILVIQLLTGEVLENLGYTIEPLRPSWGTRLEVAARLVRNPGNGYLLIKSRLAGAGSNS